MSKSFGTVFTSDKKVEDSVPKTDKLSILADLAHEILFEAKSVYPYELWPDKITICLNRITITYVTPFSKDERPIPIEYLNTAHVTRGMFFASLSIETFGVEKPNPIHHLRIDDARIARRYILGLIECKKNGVNFGEYNMNEIKEKLQDLGKVRE
ncbi:MAG: hypothetical protein ACD_19C00426G0067 [uncultured bacterium]|nr:MAG: hypothetical protein ACD_19C00426G0067 [uncultured bacterium]